MPATEADVLALLPLVRALARRRWRAGGRAAGLSLDELISAGHVGLVEAARRFDPGVGVKFSTYAGHLAQCAMGDEIRLRIGRSVQAGRTKLPTATAFLRGLSALDEAGAVENYAGLAVWEAVRRAEAEADEVADRLARVRAAMSPADYGLCLRLAGGSSQAREAERLGTNAPAVCRRVREAVRRTQATVGSKAPLPTVLFTSRGGKRHHEKAGAA